METGTRRPSTVQVQRSKSTSFVVIGSYWMHRCTTNIWIYLLCWVKWICLEICVWLTISRKISSVRMSFADDAKDGFSSLNLNHIIIPSFIVLCLRFSGKNSELNDLRRLEVMVQRNLKSAKDAVREVVDRATVWNRKPDRVILV